MSLVYDILLHNLPQKRRITPKNWVIFNSPCCVHRGHSPDTRMRGNIKLSEDGDIGYNCYNCGYKFRFDGNSVSTSFEQFLSWLNVSREQIQQIKLDLLKNEVDGNNKIIQRDRNILWQQWETVDLPIGSQPIESFVDNDQLDEKFVNVIQYLQSRGDAIMHGYDYYWCNSTKHDLNNRIIIPFYHKNKIVGYTARYSGNPPKGTPKYWNSNIPDGFIFNNDVAEIPDRKYLILVEGPFDAISIQGCSPLGSTLSESQIHWLVNQNKKIIVLPDRQKNNQELIDSALLFGWEVSFPDWEDDVKDAADACKRYGQVYTISSILTSRTTDPVMIGIKRKMFRR